MLPTGGELEVGVGVGVGVDVGVDVGFGVLVMVGDGEGCAAVTSINLKTCEAALEQGSCSTAEPSSSKQSLLCWAMS